MGGGDTSKCARWFFYFHLSESSFTCPKIRASGLAQRLSLPFLLINLISVSSYKVSGINYRKVSFMVHIYYTDIQNMIFYTLVTLEIVYSYKKHNFYFFIITGIIVFLHFNSPGHVSFQYHLMSLVYLSVLLQ